MEEFTALNSPPNPSPEPVKTDKGSILVWLSKHWTWFVIALVCILAGFLFWKLWSVGGTPDEPSVELWIDAPEVVPSGSTAEFTVVYENHDHQSLTDLRLEMLYPEGFEFISSSIDSNNNGRVFELPDLSAGASGQIRINGVFSGNPQIERVIRSQLYYGLSNLTSTFSISADAIVRLEAPDFNLRVSAPTEVINGQKLEYVVSFQNISEQLVDRIQLVAYPPDGFEFIDTDMETVEENTWEFRDLSPGERGEVHLTGSLAGSVGDKKEFKVELLIQQDDGTLISQGRSSIVSVIADSPLKVSHTIAGSQGVVPPGTMLAYRVDYENKGTRGMSNVNITMDIGGDAVDFGTVNAEGGALVGKTVIWNASGRPELEILQPGEKGSFSVQFRVRDNLVASKVINPEVRTRAAIASDELPQLVHNGEHVVPVRSSVTAEADAEYVSGALPPRAGQETVYRVNLKVSNSFNSLENITWLSFLSSPTASLVSNSIEPPEASDIVSYTSTSGRLSWRVPNMEPYSVSAISFLVRVTPSVADVSKGVTLVKDVELSGKDSFVGEVISNAYFVPPVTDRVQP